jgi:hypothetical protein
MSRQTGKVAALAMAQTITTPRGEKMGRTYRIKPPAALMVIFLIALFSSPEQGMAQTIDGEKFHKYLYSDAHQAFVARAFSQIPKTVFQKCPGLVSKGSNSIPLKPISFSLDGFPNSGAWKQEFPVEGCGNDTTLNFYFVVGSDAKINVIVAFPGSTHADLLLQNDTLKYASEAAKPKANQCEHFDVKNTRFEGFGLPNQKRPDPGPNERFRPWWETWTLVGCGRSFDVPVDFSPSDKGTKIEALRLK